MEIAERIKSEREERGWTQAELAGRVPVGQQTVSRWEQGRTRPGRNHIQRLLEVFRLDPAELEVWLDEGDQSQGLLPPARPLNPDLPIGSLSPIDFERFCRSLLRALRPAAEVYRFGDQGDNQAGIDLYAQEPDGSITTYQCKRYGSRTDFGPAKVEATMEANTISAKHHYILLTRQATSGARKVVLGNSDWTLWDLEDIADVIRDDLDPADRVNLVDRFFPHHREDFLGLPERGPWLTAEEFFGPFDDRLKLLNHTWALVGRQAEVNNLAAFAAGTDLNRLALVIGQGGIGKSRLLRAVVAVLDAHPEMRVRFLLPGTAVAPGLVDQLPIGRSLLIIDDAHETPSLDGLFHALAVQRPETRVIAASRPYGVGQIRSVALRANLVDEPVEVKLGELSMPELIGLATEVLQVERFVGPVNDLAHTIAALTRDCPLATVIGARLVARGQIQPQTVASDPQFRHRLFSAFSEVITGQLCEPSERDVLDRLLQFFALLQPLAPEDAAFDKLLQLVVGKSHAELRRLLTRLEDAGVLVRRAGLLRLVPDVLADTIAEKACLDEHTGLSTGYVDKLFDQLGGKPLENLLVNVGKLDWRLSNANIGASGPRLLAGVWAQVESRFSQATTATARGAILETIAEVAYFQPEQALELAAQAIKDARLDLVADEPAMDPEGADLIPALVPVLRHVAYTYQCVGEATDLLWTLAKSYRLAGRSPVTTEPLRALQQIAAYGPGKPIAFLEAVIEQALGWLADAPTPGGPSPFDVLDTFLATEGTEDSFTERQFIMRPFLITAASVRPLRERVIAAAFATVKSGSLPSAVRALKTLETSLRGPIGVAGQEITDDQHSQWGPDHLAVLRRLHNLVISTPLEPLVCYEIRHVVHWHAIYGSGECQDVAQRVRADLPTDLRSRVTRCLIEGWAWIGDDGEGDMEAVEEQHRRLQAETAAEFLRDVPDARACVADLTERLAVVTSVRTGRTVEPGPFLALLIELDTNISRQVIEAVATDPSSLLRGVISVALSQLAVSAPTEAVQAARQLLEMGDLGLDRQIGHAFSVGLGPRTDLHATEIALIESLAKHADPAVRSVIVHAADNLAPTSRARAVHLLLSIDFQDSTAVAASVLGEFGRHVFSVDDLGLADRMDLLHRLEACPSLDDYAIGVFLGKLAKDQPEQVVAMIQARIDHRAAYREEPFEDIPWAWAHAGQSPLVLHDSARLDKVLAQLLDWLSGADALQADDKTPLVKAVVGTFDDPVIAGLKAWREQHPDRDGIETVSLCLGEAARSLVWREQAFIVDLIQAAESFGRDCYEVVSSNISKCAVSFGSSFGQEATAQSELLGHARRIMAELPIASPARGFYRRLAEQTEHMMRWMASQRFA